MNACWIAVSERSLVLYHATIGKHIRRFQWLRENPGKLATIMRFPRIPDLKALMVTNTIVPMQFAQDLPISADDILPIGKISKVMTEHR